MITDRIPPEIGQLTQLGVLALSSNHLIGEIPKEFGRLTSLFNLTLNDNQLFGQVPQEIGNLSNLEVLDLSMNHLSGPIPPKLGDCFKLRYLKLSENVLNGSIPFQIGNLEYLQVLLDLSQNSLNGEISQQLAKLIRLEKLNLSHNMFSGSIPSSFEEMFSLIISISSIYYQRRRNIKKQVLERSSGNSFSIWNYDGIAVFEDIVEATYSFDDKFCIETGGYGKVYKANLPTGQVVAVTKLHSFEGLDQSHQRSFRNEIQALTIICHHRNIVKLYGFYSHVRCSFLVYEYMERGTLANILSNDDRDTQLGWAPRVKVIKGVSHAISYLHHDCTLPIVHQDLSSSNVLLNLELEACVFDFGTARMLIPDLSNWTTLAGTYGYIVPG
ncbi:MDIS1-interacting receptor like kinase 2-like [Magnolia sinica]|uniref:MDIS1-interacting receptor like kinase 2-like n=1 Tax=Magnolia sinica TaxID=86752 RepID=UPI00265B2F95|nr:MDIS1-interacting receptor like kinase 2-like [Magnolia sinica]